MQYSEEIKCLKCFSFSPQSMSYCRYCHHRFGQSSFAINEEDREEKRSSTKLIIVGTGLCVLVAGYLIFK
jgi:hypothetical protein